LISTSGSGAGAERTTAAKAAKRRVATYGERIWWALFGALDTWRESVKFCGGNLSLD